MAASVYSVEQVNSYIKNLFTQDFALRQIYVRGEISNCKYHTSGHIYFTLKDASGVLNAVMFRSQRQSLKIRRADKMADDKVIERQRKSKHQSGNHARHNQRKLHFEKAS